MAEEDIQRSYIVEEIRDRVLGLNIFLEPIARIIIGYSLTIGDLLMYMPRVYPDADLDIFDDGDDDELLPYRFCPRAADGAICININPIGGTIDSFDGDDCHAAELCGNDDPWSEICTVVCCLDGDKPRLCNTEVNEYINSICTRGLCAIFSD